MSKFGFAIRESLALVFPAPTPHHTRRKALWRRRGRGVGANLAGQPGRPGWRHSNHLWWWRRRERGQGKRRHSCMNSRCIRSSRSADCGMFFTSHVVWRSTTVCARRPLARATNFGGCRTSLCQRWFHGAKSAIGSPLGMSSAAVAANDKSSRGICAAANKKDARLCIRLLNHAVGLGARREL